jgi:Uncharacterised nucleotidyltransferase
LSSPQRYGSFWPGATQRGLLEVALGPVEDVAGRWHALQPVDVPTLEPGSFGLLPLLYERLSEAVPDEPQLPRLLGTYRSIWYRNQLWLERLAVLLPLLRQRAHVQPFLVGGMSALLRWYPRLGLRPVPQLELMVEREAAADVVKVAGFAGWRPTREATSFTRLRDESGRLLLVHHGAPLPLAGPLGGEGLARFRERALELAEVDGAPLVLDSVDELLFLCAFGARTAAVPSCQWLIDVHSLLRSGETPPAEEVVRRARAFHVVEPLRETLAYLGELGDTDVVEELLAALETQPTSRRDRFAFRLAGAGGRRVVPPAQALSIHLQATADEPLHRVVTRLPRALQQSWGAGSLLELPVLALRKTARLLGPEVHTRPAGRSRSASS